MNRIFHVRILWYQYVYLVLIGLLTFYLLWDKSIILAAICMILLVVLIERFIHTTYTVTTDGKLILFTGRFSRTKTIWLKDIVSVQRRHSVKIGGSSLMQYVMIGLNSGRYVSVVPMKEQEFVDLLDERRKAIEKQF